MTTEHRVSGEDFLSGLARGREPSKPYRSEGEKAKELATIKTLTSKLGLIAEHSAMAIWSNTLPQSGSNLFTLQGVNNLAYVYTLHRGLKRNGTYPDTDTFEARLVGEPSLVDLIHAVDDYYHNGVAQLWQEQAENGFKFPHYIVETCLSLAQEAVTPSFRADGLLVPNMYYSGDTTTQIDGLLLHRVPSQFSNYCDLIDDGMHYRFVSVKMLFRDKYTWTDKRMSRPRLADRAQSQQQMAKHAMWLWSNGVKNNLLPSANMYIYLRGGYPTKIFSEPVDLNYVADWHRGLGDKLGRWADGELFDDQDWRVDRLTDFWEPLSTQFELLVERRRRTLIDLNAFIGSLGDINGFEQLPLNIHGGVQMIDNGGGS